MNLLVFRFSAMGDVALTQPVIKNILENNPDIHITFVSHKNLAPLFSDLPRFTFIGVDLKADYNGFLGIFQLFNFLKKTEKYHHIIDLHSVLRTWVLCFLFSLKGISYKRIDKGRKEKKQLTDKHKKQFALLNHTTERYTDVFKKIGLKTSEIKAHSISPTTEASNSLKPFLTENNLLQKNKRWIGIAPFSKHKQKEWGIKKVNELIALLSKNDTTVFLFGGGKSEIERLEKLASTHNNTIVAAGKLDFEKEMALIAQLDAMVTMDSFNMHLAGLLGIKVVSIWGATHHFAGFGPLGENKNYIVDIPQEKLSCRPCSVFGNKPCHRGDHACMEQLQVENVMAFLK